MMAIFLNDEVKKILQQLYNINKLDFLILMLFIISAVEVGEIENLNQFFSQAHNIISVSLASLLFGKTAKSMKQMKG